MTQIKIEDVQALLTKEVHIIVDENNKAIAYEILTGEFKGVRYAYQDVKIEPKLIDGEERMELEFNSLIFNRPDFPDLDELKFKQFIANIYIKIIENCAT